MNRAEAIAELRSWIAEDDDICSFHEPIYLPESILDEIAATDVPPGVAIGIGVESRDTVEECWEGRLIRDNNSQSFSCTILHELSPKYWLPAINVRFYLDLIFKCIQNTKSIPGLSLMDFDTSDDAIIRLIYSYPVAGTTLKDAFDNARRIQAALELPAYQVLDDVTRELARSAEHITSGGYESISSLVADVEDSTAPEDKGKA